MLTFDGSLIDIGAVWGYRPGDLDAIRSVFPIPPGPGSATARAILAREPVHILDPAADPEYGYAALFRFGTILSIPMLRDGKPLGAITVTRNRIERFSDSQIDLLKTFADQAVIAIETVRLFNELNARTHDLQESLEYQTATSDVLKVIMLGDEQQAMARKINRLDARTVATITKPGRHAVGCICRSQPMADGDGSCCIVG